MNLDEIKQLAALLKKSDLSEIEIEKDGVRLKVVNSRPTEQVIAQTKIAQPVYSTPNTQAEQPQSHGEQKPDEKLHIIKSPIVGTFYSSSSPDIEAFIQVGTKVKQNSVVCIIEAMKVMNEILADVDGEIVEVLVKSCSAVEYGEPLFKVKLS